MRRLSTYGSTQKTMEKLKLRAYHVRSVQELKNPDNEKRLVYYSL